MRHLAHLLLVLAVLVPCGFAQGDRDQDQEQEQLRALEKDCAAALVSVDIPFLASFYADGWMLIGNDGQRYSRQQTLALLSLGKVKWESCVYDDIQVRIFGDTATVIYKATAVGEVNGARIEETEICSDTFIRVDGKWRCVHSHNSRVL